MKRFVHSIDNSYQFNQQLLSLDSYFSYIFFHENVSHLWLNVAVQVVTSIMISFKHSCWIGCLEVVVVYFLAGLAGALSFQYVAQEPIRLIGSSASVYGLIGISVVDTFQDLAQWIRISFAIEHQSYSSIDDQEANACHSSIIIFFIRTTVSGACITIDIYQFLESEDPSKIQQYVHLGGLICGIVLDILFRLFKWIKRSYTAQNYDPRYVRREDLCSIFECKA